MENILLLLSLFAVVKSLFMTSLLPNRWYRLGFSILLGIFVLLCHPFAMEQNKLQIQKLLSTQSAMLDISLIVMVDSLLSFYFCFARIKDWEPGKKFKWYTTFLRHMPSLLIFPALYYIHINMFFSFPGLDFMKATAGLALIVTVIFGLASFFMRKLVHEKDTLIEVVLLLTMFLFILVICSTIFHPSATVYSHSTPVNWTEFLSTLGLLAGLILIGFLYTYIKKIFKR